jgi:hypothetical protein
VISCLTEGLGIGLVRLRLRVLSSTHQLYVKKDTKLYCGKSHKVGTLVYIA